MLPLSSKQTVKVTTKDGTTVELSYLLGRMQLAYFGIVDDMSRGNKLIKKAERFEGDPDLEVNEEYDAIMSEAQKILTNYRCNMVDLFVVKIGDVEVKAVSKDLTSNDVEELASLILDNFEVITGRKKEDVKN